ncbi:hypothetical protein QY895_12015 [Latilactobacillus sakei]|uniref:hypothetical protein n=1 Tax=Latilactobacillus sakei TaxID=1599 RepID=UPI0020738935|nr:hypothetical protein [Latilactobacillus sakei]USG05162.1 hypothetical protein A4W87_09765 [Latilactobacillus sakei]USG07040.1 hypothetical protein A4W88_10340 [Latilactobacillus sakei]
MKKYRKYIIAVMTVLLIVVGLTACGKSTAQDLQSHQWTFASSKDNGMAGLLCQESGHKSTNKFDFQFKLLNLIFGGRSFSPVQILKTL